MNGWLKKNSGTIISTLIVLLGLIASTVALSSEMRSDIKHLQDADTRHEAQFVYTRECYNDVNYKLGKISGQLETLIKLNKEE